MANAESHAHDSETRNRWLISRPRTEDGLAIDYAQRRNASCILITARHRPPRLVACKPPRLEASELPLLSDVRSS